MDVVHLHSWVVSVPAIDLLLRHVAYVATTARQIIGKSIVVPSLQWNGSGVEAFVFQCNDLFVAFLSNHDSRVTPAEVILIPEGVDREDKAINGKCDDVDDHPSHVLPLSSNDENDCLQPIHRCDHDDRDQWELAGA